MPQFIARNAEGQHVLTVDAHNEENAKARAKQATNLIVGWADLELTVEPNPEFDAEADRYGVAYKMESPIA